jgi:hypothetical protein
MWESSHLWEVSPYMGSLPMYAKSSHMQEDFPKMGRLPVNEDSPYKWNKSYLGN